MRADSSVMPTERKHHVDIPCLVLQLNTCKQTLYCLHDGWMLRLSDVFADKFNYLAICHHRRLCMQDAGEQATASCSRSSLWCAGALWTALCGCRAASPAEVSPATAVRHAPHCNSWGKVLLKVVPGACQVYRALLYCHCHS